MGSLTTWSLIGMVIGGAIGGILSDKFGRKITLTLAIAFYGVFTLPQAFAPNYEIFAAFRLIAGLGVGSCIPVVTTCFSETMPSKNRGIFITFGMAFMVLGWVLAGIVAGAIQNQPEPIIAGLTEAVSGEATGGATVYANWRVCYIIGAIPIIYAVLLFFFMKETPAWYVSKGRLDEAVKRLNEIERSVKGTTSNLDPAFLITPPKPPKTSPATLFSRKYIVATCAIWSCYFIGQFCVYGMNAWLPTWLGPNGVGFEPTQAVQLQTWNNVAAIASNVSVGFVSDAIGRKRNLGFAWIFAIAAVIICSLFVTTGASFGLCIALMLLFGYALNYAITAVQPLMPESYPTEIRNMGVSWCQAFARFGGAASPIVLGALANSPIFKTEAGTNWNGLLLVLIIPLALAFICTLVFVQRETKGKSMDQLQVEIETA
jgi:MFS family permease